MPAHPAVSRTHGPLECNGPVILLVTPFRPDAVGAIASGGTSGFRIPERFSLGWLRRLRAFIDTHRDHFANPVPLSRQLERAFALVGKLGESRCRVLVDACLLEGHEALAATGGAGGYEVFQAEEGPLPLRAGELLVWVWPDPLGLASARFEREYLVRSEAIWVLNGRGRLFRLDASMRRRLSWHRFLAASRLPELAAGVLLWPLGLSLALWEIAFGRRGAEKE